MSVQEVSAFPPGGLRNQYSQARQPGRMVLYELHVFQSCASAIGQGHPISSVDGPVSSEREHPATTPGCQDYRSGSNHTQGPSAKLQGDYPPDLPFMDDQRGNKPFVVPDDGGELEEGLEEGMEQMETSLIGSEKSPLDAHSAESSRR